MKSDFIASLSQNTKKQYQKSWEKFCNFMDRLNDSPLPTKPENLPLYVTYMHRNGLKSSTIRSNLSAISFKHKANGYSLDVTHPVIVQLLKGYKKNEITTLIRRPISQEILDSICRSTYLNTLNPPSGSMYRALFSLMYHASLRVSEVARVPNSFHTLKYNEVQLSRNKVVIRLSSYKHSKGKGELTPISLERKQYASCPVKLMQAYLQDRNGSQGQFFLLEGLPVTASSVSRELKTVLQHLGYNSTLYNTHSFRIGKTTDMAMSGSSEEQICMAGRWHSDAFRKYIKPNIINI